MRKICISRQPLSYTAVKHEQSPTDCDIQITSYHNNHHYYHQKDLSLTKGDQKNDTSGRADSFKESNILAVSGSPKHEVYKNINNSEKTKTQLSTSADIMRYTTANSSEPIAKVQKQKNSKNKNQNLTNKQKKLFDQQMEELNDQLMVIGGGPALRDANNSGFSSPKSRGKSVSKKYPFKRPSTSNSNSQLSNGTNKQILPLTMKRHQNITKKAGFKLQAEIYSTLAH